MSDVLYSAHPTTWAAVVDKLVILYPRPDQPYDFTQFVRPDGKQWGTGGLPSALRKIWFASRGLVLLKTKSKEIKEAIIAGNFDTVPFE